jgi:hypothetical protein
MNLEKFDVDRPRLVAPVHHADADVIEHLGGVVFEDLLEARLRGGLGPGVVHALHVASKGRKVKAVQPRSLRAFSDAEANELHERCAGRELLSALSRPRVRSSRDR